MKWFIVLNSNADLWFRDMVKVAIGTARKYTTLEPHCIYDGADTELSRWMESRGVTMHRFRVPFHERLFSDDVVAANTAGGFSSANASGIYLKLFISEFCAPDEKFVFTDCDIMFTKDFDLRALNAAAGEFRAVIESHSPPQGLVTGPVFNSGVFVTDARTFKGLREQFLRVLEERKYFFWGNPGFYDQGLLNVVLAGQWKPLDARLNWRPFWGLSVAPMIWHFHGAKPLQIERILAGQPDPIDNPDIIQMVGDNRPEYEHLLRRFRAELADTESPSATTKPAVAFMLPPAASANAFPAMST